MRRTLGAYFNDNGTCDFNVWAPFAEEVELEIIPVVGNPYRIPMHSIADGYHEVHAVKLSLGDRYYYCFAQSKYPDLASDYQPEGTNGPSAVVKKEKPEYWEGRALSSYIIYELHVGTYTPEGTLAAIIDYLPELKELGITAIELMPLAQFSGERNWGYDGVFPYAVQNSYGGPTGLRQLVGACHRHGIAVILDVVYNHLGPEGNYFDHYGPYLTDKYKTPWGKTLNFDGEYSREVRKYFIENALHWFIEYGIDALRLDALHAIVDTSAYPFLEELADKVKLLSQELGREYYLIAESSANDTRLIRPKEQFGFGLHAQWNDEFHHALHILLTKEKANYYQDYGSIEQFIKALTEGYVYSGEYSTFRKKPHGISSKEVPAERFVVFMQNHDHIGNRPLGDRLVHQLSEEQIRFYAALLFFSPYIPLIFMGEEYAEEAPFYYFTSHQNQELVQAVREGRKKEFSFLTEEELPDPNVETTFRSSKLNHRLKQTLKYRKMWLYYRKIIELRKGNPALYELNKENISIRLITKNFMLLRNKKFSHSSDLCQPHSLCHSPCVCHSRVGGPSTHWHNATLEIDSRLRGNDKKGSNDKKDGNDNEDDNDGDIKLVLIVRKNKKQKLFILANFSEKPCDYSRYISIKNLKVIFNSYHWPEKQFESNQFIPPYGVLIFEKENKK